MTGVTRPRASVEKTIHAMQTALEDSEVYVIPFAVSKNCPRG